jgi:hypothetical protein
MFGQQQGGGGQEVPRGNDVKMDLDLTLEQLYVGDVVEMMRAKPVRGSNSDSHSFLLAIGGYGSLILECTRDGEGQSCS